MTRLRICSMTAGLIALFNSTVLVPAADSPTADFNEVYGLLKEHLAGTSEAELNQAAVQGLISKLGPRVAILGDDTVPSGTGKALVSNTNLFDGQIGYLRISRVADGLPDAVRQAVRQLGATNDLNGLVLDLRFAGGQDYAAAAATADLFLQKDRPLLDWGQGMVASKEKTDALSLPVTLLVNRQTAGAAEALAAVLRQTGAGLVLGSRTAGQAVIAQDYPLKSGERLRIATAPVHLGDGTTISVDGVKPDISVTVGAQAERSYLEDAYKEPTRTNSLVSAGLAGTNNPASTNRARRPRFNEAELVRERREGYNPDAEAPQAELDAEQRMVRDPALARAIDVLKGLALVRRAHS